MAPARDLSIETSERMRKTPSRRTVFLAKDVLCLKVKTLYKKNIRVDVKTTKHQDRKLKAVALKNEKMHSKTSRWKRDSEFGGTERKRSIYTQ